MGTDNLTILNDGTLVRRVFESDVLEQQRIIALNKAGKSWLYHPCNYIQKDTARPIRDEKDSFLTNYFKGCKT